MRRACDICGQLVVSIRQHMRLIHKQTVSHRCPTCGKEFPVLARLKNHIGCTHAPDTQADGQPSLPDVRKGVPGPGQTEKPHVEHMRLIHKQTVSHRCPTCGKEFPVLARLKNHIGCTHAPDTQADGQPSLPDVRQGVPGPGQTEESHVEHMRLIHKQTVSHRCPTCGKEFPVLARLKNHIRSKKRPRWRSGTRTRSSSRSPRRSYRRRTSMWTPLRDTVSRTRRYTSPMALG
ncbi:Uncharacterized protein OBRU01_10828 [Operophtera brumata]|uniref:C2H2-type domain-containing protein n=1 Tax=Operophtera brumata TaxID=104452 RepID=A0A0L7LCY5_OPEBR|nr:Uncharacterized protein OBRU01_10828 [Operophtera brumata]